jgi:FixJ family two-component response regulator
MDYGDPAPPLICVVDDDVSFREALAGLLQSFGFSTASFESATDFLSSEHLRLTACLILDVLMPRMSGLELQAELAARGQIPPIIFITSRVDARTRARALTAGALGVLGKPFDRDELLSHLRRALGRDERGFDLRDTSPPNTK